MEEEQLDIELNTEKLISLVKDQPTIYDKTLPPLDQKEKQNLWLNICKQLVPGWEERPQLEKTQIGIKVYSRWKNLRTCFRREYNLQKEESKAHRHGNPFIQKKRKQYEFYDQLLFLLPTVAIKKCSSKNNSSQESEPKKRTMTSRAVSPVVFQDTPMSLHIPGIHLPAIQISRVDAGQAAQQTAQSQASQPRTVPSQASQPTIAQSQPTQTAHQFAPGQPTQPAHQFAPGQVTQPVPPYQTAQQRPTVDEDRHFLLSVLPALQRMSRSQKLKAKMKFLQALSDVDAETRETLQRYVCFARQAPDQDYNLPEPFSGGVPVRPFVMQADHTYYLVREKGTKRARMMPETANTDPHHKFEEEYYHEYTIDTNPATEEDAKSHESIEIGQPRDCADDAKSDESVEFGSLQQATDSGNLQKNLEVGKVQKTIQNGGPQNPVAVGGTQDSNVIAIKENEKKTVEPNVVQEVVEDEVQVGVSKDNVAESKENKEAKADPKKTVEAGISQENIKVANVQVPAEVGNLEDNVEVFTTQENVASGGEPVDIARVKDEFMLDVNV